MLGRGYARPNADLRRLDGALALEAPATATEPFTQQTYESRLREHLGEHGVEVAAIPQTSEGLVDRGVTTTPPV